MTRQQLEHILRASAGITGADRFIIIGSQAILGQYPDPPRELAESIEADIFTDRSPDDSNLIDGSIGEGSPFHTTFGYHAHGVAIETATLPAGWRDRLVPVTSPSIGGAIGLCLEVHDLAVSKLVAGREKDLNFLRALFRHALADPHTVEQRLAGTPLDAEAAARCTARLQRLLKPTP
ncbi:MAG TPA: hypothetical protein PKE29_17820 [Phycisphaerales bacterium]|nr:hypothetical protein [Phycisphaerales bacterium]